MFTDANLDVCTSRRVGDVESGSAHVERHVADVQGVVVRHDGRPGHHHVRVPRRLHLRTTTGLLRL